MHPALQKTIELAKAHPRIGAAVVLLVFAGVLTAKAMMVESIVDEQTWAVAERGDLVRELIESGEIQAVEAEFVKAPREWRMDLQVIDLAPEGSFVKEGDFLVQFDTSTLDEELLERLDVLKQAEADLKSVDTEQANEMSTLASNLKISEYSLEAARLNVEMMQYEARSLQEEAEIDLKSEELRYEEAQKKIETQRIINAAERQKTAFRVEQAKMEVASINRRIEGLTLTAPISGMVVYQEIGGHGPDAPSKKVAIGDKVRSGRPVVSIPNLSQMKMVIKVNEIDANSIARNDDVEIALDAFPDEKYHGVVSYVSRLVEKGGNFWDGSLSGPSVEVHVLINETSEMLKPGMTARAIIELDLIPNVVMAPVGTVYEISDGTTVVFPRDRYPQPQKVTLGGRNDSFHMVTEGLDDGEELAWVAPENIAYPLGWQEEMERRRLEYAQLVGHIDTMTERGITNNPARADSLKKALQPEEPLSPDGSGGDGAVIMNK